MFCTSLRHGIAWHDYYYCGCFFCVPHAAVWGLASLGPSAPSVFIHRSDEPRVPSLTHRSLTYVPSLLRCLAFFFFCEWCARVNNERLLCIIKALDGGNQPGIPCVALGALPAEGGHARCQSRRASPRSRRQVRCFQKSKKGGVAFDIDLYV